MPCPYFGKDCDNTDCNPEGATVSDINIVPLTAKEDAELREQMAEPTAGELGLCGFGPKDACEPGCCGGPAMTREEAKADAEAASREFTAIKIDPDGGLDLRSASPMVDIAEPGWAPKMAEMLGGAHMSILLQAEKITNGQRQKDYGNAKSNHDRIAALWTAFLQGRRHPDSPLAADEVAIMMILMKLARLMWSPGHQDTLVDVAGYANVISKMFPDE